MEAAVFIGVGAIRTAQALTENATFHHDGPAHWVELVPKDHSLHSMLHAAKRGTTVSICGHLIRDGVVEVHEMFRLKPGAVPPFASVTLYGRIPTGAGAMRRADAEEATFRISCHRFGHQTAQDILVRAEGRELAEAIDRECFPSSAVVKVEGIPMRDSNDRPFVYAEAVAGTGPLRGTDSCPPAEQRPDQSSSPSSSRPKPPPPDQRSPPPSQSEDRPTPLEQSQPRRNLPDPATPQGAAVAATAPLPDSSPPPLNRNNHPPQTSNHSPLNNNSPPPTPGRLL